MLKHLIYIIPWALLNTSLKAQNDSTSVLNNVTIVEQRVFNLSSGLKYALMDSLVLANFQGQDLGELLNYNSPVFIKSQGPGNLATTSFRGGSSSHTAVLWNGFNINSSMNGLVDLSLIPNALHDNISVQYGSSTALWGSGALGGAIHLENRPYFKKKLSLGYSFESFSYQDFSTLNGFSQSLKLQQGSKRWHAYLSVFKNQNDNHYPYSIKNELESGRSINPKSNINNRGLSADFYYKLTDKQLLEIHYWLQDLNRAIAPGLNEVENNARLSDRTHRIAAQYGLQSKFGKWSFRSAYFHKDLLFSTDFIEDAPSLSSNFINELNWDHLINNEHFISAGLNYNFNTASNKNYADLIVDTNQELVEENQNRLAFFTALRSKFINDKLDASLSLRQELLNGEAVPFTYSIGFDYKLPFDIDFGLSHSKIYRIPNLNDLYWNPGGNPDLQSEDGYTIEGKLQKQFQAANYRVSLSYAAFYRRVNNWIQWTPGIVWSPQNLLEVESYGNEFTLNSSCQLGNWEYGLNLGLSYVVSQNLRSNNNTDASLRKQLIYTPLYKGNSSAFVIYRKFSARYMHQYIGYVYVTTDHSEFIEPYDPASFRIQYQQDISKLSTTIWVGIQNLYNEDYQIVIGRPMPLRTYNIGLKININ